MSSAQDPVVVRIKARQRESVPFRAAWAEYVKHHGGGNRDPTRHSPDFLHSALEWCESQAEGGGAVDAEQFALVEKVKQHQRSSDEWKQMWAEHVSAHGGGVNDPTRHDRAFLEQAIARIDHLLHARPQVIDAIKQRQKSSLEFKDAWGKHCKLHGEGNRDPNRHTTAWLEEAVAACDKVVGSGCGPDPEVLRLVDEVKRLQKQHPEMRQQWMEYAQREGGGVFDPSRHTADFLRGALTQLGAAPLAITDGGGRGGGGGGGAEPPLPPGWIAHHDPNYNQPYYHHAATGQTVWERPEAAPAPRPQPPRPPPQQPYRPPASALSLPGSQLPGSQLPGSHAQGASQLPGSQLPRSQLPGSQFPGGGGAAQAAPQPQRPLSIGMAPGSLPGSQLPSSQMPDARPPPRVQTIPRALPGSSIRPVAAVPADLPSSQLPASQLPPAEQRYQPYGGSAGGGGGGAVGPGSPGSLPSSQLPASQLPPADQRYQPYGDSGGGVGGGGAVSGGLRPFGEGGQWAGSIPAGSI